MMLSVCYTEIKWLIEQAKRVQDLEDALRIWMDRSDQLSGEYLRFKEQNSNYREALEVAFLRLSNKYNIDETRDDILKVLEVTE